MSGLVVPGTGGVRLATYAQASNLPEFRALILRLVGIKSG